MPSEPCLLIPGKDYGTWNLDNCADNSYWVVRLVGAPVGILKGIRVGSLVHFPESGVDSYCLPHVHAGMVGRSTAMILT